jgi:pimeloyl-ACP methyl ester carboxylesterase
MKRIITPILNVLPGVSFLLLTSRGIADLGRVEVYGWSYGGYLCAMCFCRAPDVFHIAVAGAPVTSWALTTRTARNATKATCLQTIGVGIVNPPCLIMTPIYMRQTCDSPRAD